MDALRSLAALLLVLTGVSAQYGNTGMGYPMGRSYQLTPQQQTAMAEAQQQAQQAALARSLISSGFVGAILHPSIGNPAAMGASLTPPLKSAAMERSLSDFSAISGKPSVVAPNTVPSGSALGPEGRQFMGGFQQPTMGGMPFGSTGQSQFPFNYIPQQAQIPSSFGSFMPQQTGMMGSGSNVQPQFLMPMQTQQGGQQPTMQMQPQPNVGQNVNQQYT